MNYSDIHKSLKDIRDCQLTEAINSIERNNFGDGLIHASAAYQQISDLMSSIVYYHKSEIYKE